MESIDIPIFDLPLLDSLTSSFESHLLSSSNAARHTSPFVNNMKHPMDDQHLRRDGSSERSSENDTSIILVRYLTPYKIAVAIVIVLYLSGLIPQSQKPRVMGYIISFLDTQIKQHDALMESTIESDLSALENVLSRCPAVNSLGKRVHSDGRERDDGGLFNSLLDILFTMSSIDELHTFINRLPLFVIKGDGKHDDEDNDKIAEAQSLGVNWVTQSSVLGTYFTKCFLSFDSLTFDQAIVLWNCLIAFRSPYQTKIPPHPFALKNFSNFSDSSNSLFKAFFGPHFSQTDSHGFNFLQHLLPPPQPIRCVASETLDMVLESKVSTLDRSDGISLHSINRILSTLSENDKSLPVSAHYIKYFSSLQEHDYEQAFEHLHRFYDYTMHRHGRAQYHNALFTLATLHAEFESFEEALRAVSEAISVARENKDISALTNIHFWLYNFITLHPDCKIPEFFSSKEQMLQFLKVKSQDTSLGLYSLTLQHEALHHLVTCGSLTQTLEALFKSSFISIISNSISSAISYCSLMVSTCNRLGISSSALLYNELSSDLSKKASNTWPIIESTIQRAELLFEKGELSNAFKLLESVRPLARESQLSYRQWYWSYMLLKLKHSINENKLDEASFILERLAPLANLSYRTRANHQIYKILLLSKSGAKTLAKEQAWSLIDSLAKEDSDILYSLRLMVIYIEIILVSFFLQICRITELLITN